MYRIYKVLNKFIDRLDSLFAIPLEWMAKLLMRVFCKLEYNEYIDKHFRSIWFPSIGFFNTGKDAHFGIYIDLVCWVWRADLKKPYDIYPANAIGIQVRPFWWEFGQEHVYYDGPHCIYSLGPFKFYTDLKWCNKCHGDK